MTRSTGNSEAHQTAPRLFVSAALREGAQIAGSAEQAHYLGTVLRHGLGDVVRLFNGADGEWAARVGLVRRDRLTLTVTECLRGQAPEAGPWLVFALLKRDATDLVVRQAVELGASRVLPVITERTNAARVNETRLRAIAVEAAEQSERLTVPHVDPVARLDAVLAAWPTDRRLFVALERSWDAIRHGPAGLGQLNLHRAATGGPDKPGHDDLGCHEPGCHEPGCHDGASEAQGGAARKAALLIGPEGGFTPGEREMLRRLAVVTPISLGPYVLRAETAAAAGLALLLGMGWAEYVAPHLTPT
jgi:16S rRNA (uracil1498-N3)-methyltransferase